MSNNFQCQVEIYQANSPRPTVSETILHVRFILFERSEITQLPVSLLVSSRNFSSETRRSRRRSRSEFISVFPFEQNKYRTTFPRRVAQSAAKRFDSNFHLDRRFASFLYFSWSNVNFAKTLYLTTWLSALPAFPRAFL